MTHRTDVSTIGYVARSKETHGKNYHPFVGMIRRSPLDVALVAEQGDHCRDHARGREDDGYETGDTSDIVQARKRNERHGSTENDSRLRAEVSMASTKRPACTITHDKTGASTDNKHGTSLIPQSALGVDGVVL